DRSGAIPLYLDAARADPDHAEAADRASQLLWKAGRFRDVLPILELLVRKPAPEPLLLHRLLQLADAAARAGEREKAVKALTRALEITPDTATALRARADLLTEEERWGEVEADLLALREKHGAALPAADRAQLGFELVRTAARLGHNDDARERLGD